MRIVKDRVRAGFTLLELLIVISVVAVLASIVIASLPGIMANIKRKSIRQFVAELEAGLEDYKQDNAIYPLNPEGGGASGSSKVDDGVAVQGAVILYKHLSGDFDMDGQGTVDDDMTIYVERLDNWSNRERNGRKPGQERSAPFQGGYAVVDPLGGPVRYVAFPPNMKNKPTRNPTYDMWSVAGADAEHPDFSDEAKWITNWGN
ncbi:MAG: prepilin-type N-terminal cleavage/methylation domain-containing protein [Akkermansiaceae bacterium]|nr:prepilin-type N-terminal cleavage/methylation domain-containing protein [Akkermansiaceae bacterium]MCP5551459.1 prepilin-type N-terminal cleavage/methylation domain-containing protein [Akkermansiaceae bacterium]